MRTPLTLVTGFLGSGKTTLLRQILSDTQHKIAIVMNEFGEIAIDAKVLQGKNVDIAELGGGCVCCSLVGEFAQAIAEIIARAAPDLIVVETTGLAEPEALTGNIQDSLPDLIYVDGVIAIADADAIYQYPQLGHTTRLQLEMADMVLINKTDLVAADELKVVETRLRRVNPHAIFFYTVRCRLDTRVLFGISAAKASGTLTCTTHEHQPHDHEISFQSFTYTTPAILDLERWEFLANNLPAEVYRAKGLIRFTPGGRHFNYVRGRWDMEECQVATTEFVFIGPDVANVRDQIIQKIQSCELRSTPNG